MINIENSSKSIANTNQNNDISIYIHWPYCEKKCPYCDFNSHVAAQNLNLSEYNALYISALLHYKPILDNKNIVSVFFGGGTPSLAPVDLIHEIITHLKIKHQLSSNAEITLEANPNSTDMRKMQLFKEAGINRISLGIQSLKDDSLKFLGRTHTKDCALNALEVVASIYEHYSFDLIYALPNQNHNDWQEELNFALQFANKHMSLYQLTIENNTAFGNLYKRGLLNTMPDDDAAALYELTQEIMNARGLPAYEISNHAAPGHESVHNMRYWQYKDFIGIGPGAHGRIITASQDRDYIYSAYYDDDAKQNFSAPLTTNNKANINLSAKNNCAPHSSHQNIADSYDDIATQNEGYNHDLRSAINSSVLSTRLAVRRAEDNTNIASHDEHNAAHGNMHHPNDENTNNANSDANYTQDNAYIAAVATIDERIPHKWMENVQKNGHGLTTLTPLSLSDVQQEKILMGMRIKEGISLSLLSENARNNAVAELVKLEMVTVYDDKVVATKKGALLLNQIIAMLIC